MAINYGIEILIDNTIAADKNTDVVRRVMHILGGHTRTTTYVATYSAGSTSVNQVTITVGGTGTVGIAIRVTWDTAVIGTDITPEIVRKVIRMLESEALTIAHAATYTAGNRAYNVKIVLT